MGEGAHGNIVNSCLGHGADRAFGDATTGLRFKSPSDDVHGGSHVGRVHVVEHNHVEASGLDRFLNFGQIACLDLDAERFWISWR